MTLLICCSAISLLVVLILGGVLLRNWARRRADLLIWSDHQLKLRQQKGSGGGGESTETWHDNQGMHMR